MANWDERFLELSAYIAQWSKDRSTKVGCVIIGANRELLTTGYNGFPRGVNDDIDARHERPEKYLWTEHAERNAIYNAARHGIKLEGATAYLPWFPCADCARALIQVGIATVVAVKPSMARDHSHTAKKWADEFDVSAIMLEEAGVEVRYMEESQ